MLTKYLFEGLILLIALAVLVVVFLVLKARKVHIGSILTNDKKVAQVWSLSLGIALLIFVAIFLAFVVVNN